MLRILLTSDIHFEAYDRGFVPALPDEGEFDVLVLAGDMGDLDHAVSGIQGLLRTFPYTPVVYVAGNHEFYRGSYQQTLARLRANYHRHPQVHFLENDRLELYGCTFLGCTLWSGLNGMGQAAEALIQQQGTEMIPDFRLIGFAEQGSRGTHRLFQPRDMQALHRQSLRWLESQLQRSSPQQTIVLTHFPPTMACRHPGFPQDALSAYFQADCEHLIWKYQPALWLYGHNHYSRDERYGATRLVSRPHGYPGEDTGNTLSGIIALTR